MATPYLYERQTEYWTSRGIEDYFLDAGFQVVTFPLSQIAEHEVPFDFVFFEKSTSKLFGIQYKALYRNNQDYWPLDEQQYQTLQGFRDWAYYGLSEMKSATDHRIAIHRMLFVPVSLDFQSKLYRGQLKPHYYRWGGFVSGLESCTVGRRVVNRGEIEEALHPLQRRDREEIDRHLIDVFVANLDRRRLLHLDNRL